MPFSGNQAVIPIDKYADSHGFIGGKLKHGDFLDDSGVVDTLTSWGWDGQPITDDDVMYMLTHSVGSRSLMAAFVAYLFARKLIGVVEPDAPGDSGMTNGEKLDRLEEFGQVTWTSGTAEQDFYITRYDGNNLTSDPNAQPPLVYDEPWMAAQRGLYLLPFSHEASEEADALYESLEQAIARFGLSGSFEDQQAALGVSAALRDAIVPGPGSRGSDDGVVGRLVNPRRALYRWQKIDDQLVKGNASDAAKACPALEYVLGAPRIGSPYAGLLSSQPISERAWRDVLGLPWDEDGEDAEGLNLAGGRR